MGLFQFAGLYHSRWRDAHTPLSGSLRHHVSGEPFGSWPAPETSSTPRETNQDPPLTGRSLWVRGAGGRGTHHRIRDGIIPAGAGSSGRHRTAPREHRDHPCGCGEQSVKRGSLLPYLGPSLRVRGADSLTCGFAASADSLRAVSENRTFPTFSPISHPANAHDHEAAVASHATWPSAPAPKRSGPKLSWSQRSVAGRCREAQRPQVPQPFARSKLPRALYSSL
jgi:hypothetical protein